MIGPLRSLDEARQDVREEPKRWKAAVLEGEKTPLLDSEGTHVHLYRHVKTAEEQMRERMNVLLADGWKRAMFGVSSGIVQLRRGDDIRWLAIDKRRR